MPERSNRREFLRRLGAGALAARFAVGDGALEARGGLPGRPRPEGDAGPGSGARARPQGEDGPGTGEAPEARDDAEMVVIPSGPCILGTSREDAERLAREYRCHVTWLDGEGPERRVDVPAFAIDRYPVTNRRYAAFTKAAGHPPPAHWGGPEPPREILDHPVVMVHQEDCRAFARWAGKRLPAEAEWEKAARGPEGLLFPWGDRFDPEACVWNRDDPAARDRGPRTLPVDARPKGASPYGVMDLSGNAAEWCDGAPGPGCGIVKGGSWITQTPRNLRPAARILSGFAVNRSLFVGFRCAREVRR